MNKFVALVLLLISATFLGSVYGILHDELTYTLSKEYYTKFKFIQFGLVNWGLGENIGTGKAPEIILAQPRAEVAIVGTLATWWVGLFIGIILGFVGLIHKNGKEMFKVTIKALLLAIVIALVTGFLGWVYGSIFLIKDFPNWHFPDNLIDKESFVIVGSIHNFSYLGGLIGLIFGIIFSVKQKGKYSN